MRRTLAAVGVLLLGFVLVIAARTVLASRDQQVPAIRTAAARVQADLAATHLAEAIRFQTVSRDVRSHDDAELLHLRDWLATTYPHLHHAARRTVLPGGTIVFDWPGRNVASGPIVLMAHQDVVPADEAERWKQPPFAGAIRNGIIWGRGAIDDKGSLIAIMEAAESLAAAGRAPARRIILIFGHDEEVSGAGAREAAAFLKAQGARPWFVLDEGSIAVTDHPVSHRPAALVGISEKGYLTLRLDATANGGHSSSPPDTTAVSDLATATLAVANDQFPRHYRGATRQMLEALAPDAPLVTRVAIANAWLFEGVLSGAIGETPQGAAMLHTTIAPTMLRASPKENVLASTASAWINFRLDPGDSISAVKAHVAHALKKSKVKVVVVGSPQEPSPVSPVDGDAYRFLAGVIRGQFDMPVAPAPVVAMTDARALHAISPAIYRFQPIALAIRETEMLHGADERIPVKDLARMIAFYQALMLEAPRARAPSH